MIRTLYHASSFRGFANLNVGDVVELRPGTQCAQGAGVYFSEGTPDVRASDSVAMDGLACIFQVIIDTDRTWWKSKGGKDAKKGRPRTWHSNGSRVRLVVESAVLIDGVQYYTCTGQKI